MVELQLTPGREAELRLRLDNGEGQKSSILTLGLVNREGSTLEIHPITTPTRNSRILDKPKTLTRRFTPVRGTNQVYGVAPSQKRGLWNLYCWDGEKYQAERNREGTPETWESRRHAEESGRYRYSLRQLQLS